MSGGGSRWRFSLEEVLPGRGRQGYPDLVSLIAFLRARFVPDGVPSEPVKGERQMSKNVVGISVVRIKPGELENFKAVVKELVAATQANEPGAMAYEYYVSQDGEQCHILERYVDSAAVMAHLANFAPFAERFMAAVEMTGLTLYGNPSDEVREAVSGFDPVFVAPMDGFAR